MGGLYLVKSHLKVCKLGEGSEETTKEFSFKGWVTLSQRWIFLICKTLISRLIFVGKRCIYRGGKRGANGARKWVVNVS